MSPPERSSRAGRHEERAAELIAHEAATWIAREVSGQSMITVTRALLSSRGERAVIYVSVFPQDEMRPALSFLERSARDFRTHLAKHIRLHPLPMIEFAIESPLS